MTTSFPFRPPPAGLIDRRRHWSGDGGGRWWCRTTGPARASSPSLLLSPSVASPLPSVASLSARALDPTVSASFQASVGQIRCLGSPVHARAGACRWRLRLVGAGSVRAGSGVPPSPATGCALRALAGLLRGSSRWGGSLNRGLPAAESIQARSGAVPSSSAPSGSATPGVWPSSGRRSMLAGLVPVAVGRGLAWSGCFWAALVVVW
jgi:hypothetical protein